MSTKTTAIVKYKKAEIISEFSGVVGRIQKVDELTDPELFRYMRVGLRISLRITAEILRPLCASFMKRFKRAKKAGKDFHGHTDFDRAAEKLTGYSGRQVRNLAAGTPTPPRPKQLTAAKKLAQQEARRRQDQVDLANARAVAIRKARTAESAVSDGESQAIPTSPVSPVPGRSVIPDPARTTPAPAPVAAAKEITRLSDAEEVNALLDYILKSIKVGTAPSVTIGNQIHSLAEKIRFHRTRGTA